MEGYLWDWWNCEAWRIAGELQRGDCGAVDLLQRYFRPVVETATEEHEDRTVYRAFGRFVLSKDVNVWALDTEEDTDDRRET